MVYLDNSATTRVSDKAAEKALEVMTKNFGNPSSLHSLGFEAEQIIKGAKKNLASALGCKEGEVFFTSGGTEANNIAILGTAQANIRRGNRIVISAVEHSSVLEAAESLVQSGFEVIKIYPEKDGSISPQKVADAVDDKTILVSLMLSNNELGTIYDVATAGAGARRKNPKVILHCDAVGAFGKIPVHTGRLGVDLLTVSAHKIHAPKGCGALFIKKGTRISPIMFGGEQQNKMRVGTESTPLIAAFSEALSEAIKNMPQNYAKAKELRNELVKELLEIENISINSPENAIPYVVNFSTNQIKSETLIHFMEKKDIFVSGGSACSKGKKSHVLVAHGFADKRIDTAIRVSFCCDNSKEDILVFIDALKEALSTLQKIK